MTTLKQDSTCTLTGLVRAVTICYTCGREMYYFKYSDSAETIHAIAPKTHNGTCRYKGDTEIDKTEIGKKRAAMRNATNNQRAAIVQQTALDFTEGP